MHHRLGAGSAGLLLGKLLLGNPRPIVTTVSPQCASTLWTQATGTDMLRTGLLGQRRLHVQQNGALKSATHKPHQHQLLKQQNREGKRESERGAQSVAELEARLCKWLCCSLICSVRRLTDCSRPMT